MRGSAGAHAGHSGDAQAKVDADAYAAPGSLPAPPPAMLGARARGRRTPRTKSCVEDVPGGTDARQAPPAPADQPPTTRPPEMTVGAPARRLPAYVMAARGARGKTHGPAHVPEPTRTVTAAQRAAADVATACARATLATADEALVPGCASSPCALR